MITCAKQGTPGKRLQNFRLGRFHAHALTVVAELIAALLRLGAYRMWADLPLERFALSLLPALVSSVPAWPLVFFGPLSMIAVALLGLAALVIGLPFVPAAALRWAAFAAMLIGLASTACWLPTMQVDDLAFHFGLPSQ